VPADDGRREELRDKLAVGFRPVAENIARRYSGRGEPLDDLEQVASIGLLHALDRFQPDHGRDFLAYAVPTIMGEVRRYFRDSAWSVKTPRSVKDRYVAVNAATADMAQDLGRAPTATELAARLELSREEVVEAIAARSSYQSGSLDAALADDDPALIDILGVIDADLEHVELRALIRDLVGPCPTGNGTSSLCGSCRRRPRLRSAPSSSSPRCTFPACSLGRWPSCVARSNTRSP